MSFCCAGHSRDFLQKLFSLQGVQMNSAMQLKSLNWTGREFIRCKRSGGRLEAESHLSWWWSVGERGEIQQKSCGSASAASFSLFFYLMLFFSSGFFLYSFPSVLPLIRLSVLWHIWICASLEKFLCVWCKSFSYTHTRTWSEAQKTKQDHQW